MGYVSRAERLREANEIVGLLLDVKGPIDVATRRSHQDLWSPDSPDFRARVRPLTQRELELARWATMRFDGSIHTTDRPVDGSINFWPRRPIPLFGPPVRTREDAASVVLPLEHNRERHEVDCLVLPLVCPEARIESVTPIVEVTPFFKAA